LEMPLIYAGPSAKNCRHMKHIRHLKPAVLISAIAILALAPSSDANQIQPVTLPSIVIPDWSQLSPFESEWCTDHVSAADPDVAAICYGYVRFRDSFRVRSFLVQLARTPGAKARHELYVESQLPGVELRVLKFKVTGPINGGGVPAGEGSAVLSVDRDGEVRAIELRLPHHGSAAAMRP
jgi:hypothetical protein